MVCHHLANFDDHRYWYCSSRDIIILVRHEIKQDRIMSKGQMGQMTIRLEVLKVSFHPAMFGGHRRCSSGDVNVLVCHVI